MKRSLSLLLTLALLCALLTGCVPVTDDPCLAEPDGSDAGKVDSLVSEAPAATMRCRVITADGSNLLIADIESAYPDVYTLSTDNIPVLQKQAEGNVDDSVAAPTVGALIEVCYTGGIMETYPARFGGVTHITVLPDEFDDRCALYLSILEELWNEDSGLNANITCVSVDLSATSLTVAERSAVAWAFAQSHGAEALEYSYAELVENGYLSGADPEQDGLPHWEDGVLFTVAEEDAAFSMPPASIKNAVSLRAEKWRDALGAYGFAVTATQGSDGAWHMSPTREAWIS